MQTMTTTSVSGDKLLQLRNIFEDIY